MLNNVKCIVIIINFVVDLYIERESDFMRLYVAMSGI